MDTAGAARIDAGGSPRVAPSPPGAVGALRNRDLTGLVVGVAVLGSLSAGAAAAIKPAYALAVTVAVVAGLTALVWPVIGGYLLVAVVPITSGLRSGWPIPQVRLSEVLIAGVAVIVLLSARLADTVAWRQIDWLLLVWCVLWGVMGAYNAVRLHQGLPLRTAEVLIGPFQYLLLYRAVATSLVGESHRRRATAVLMWASVPVSLLALAQQLRLHAISAFIVNATGSSVFSTYAYHYFARATGPFDHWTPLAGYLLIIMLTGFALLLGGDPPLRRGHLQLILLLAGIGLLLSAELSALAGLVVGAIALGLGYRKTKEMGRWLGIGCVVLAVAFGSYFLQRIHTEFGASSTLVGSGRHAWIPQTLSFRWQIWTEQYFPAIGQSPLVGWGPQLPPTVRWPDSESQYVTLLMQGGCALLLSFLAVLWAVRDTARQVLRSPSGRISAFDRDLARTAAVLVPIGAIISLVFPYFTDGGLPAPFWVVVALMVGGTRSHGQLASRLINATVAQ